MEKRCTHERCKCLECGEEGSPAQLLGRRPRVRGEQAREQSRKASKIAGELRAAEAKALRKRKEAGLDVTEPSVSGEMKAVKAPKAAVKKGQGKGNKTPS